MRRHILIVDDEELFREICREMLEERGYRVSLAADAPVALAILKREPVDLLVADITLPGMDGLALIEKVHEVRPGLPAIVITGFLTEKNMLRSLNLGVRGFLTKPFFYDELFVAVEKALEHSQATRNELLLHHYRPIIHLGEEILAADPETLFSTTLRTALRIGLQQTGATHGFIALPAADGGARFELGAAMGFGPEDQPHMPAYLEAVRRALSGDAEEVASLDLIPGMNALAVRMPGGARRPGALVFARPKGEETFGDEERNLARLLAVQAAIAIHHHDAHGREAEHSHDAARTVVALAGALLPPQSGHFAGQTLAALAAVGVRVAEALKCAPEDRLAVRDALTFHNLGKAFLPPELLTRPGPLTQAEWSIMHTYPAKGAEVLARVESLRAAAPLVAAQRERWDGAGYPAGTAGEAIPLAARIVAVVSAWGAMTSARPYRAALARAEAAKALKSEAGHAFCPRVVEAFLGTGGGTGGGATEAAAAKD
jgi:response regulator RpfG family c-di-GMP phosphodiesterase